MIKTILVIFGILIAITILVLIGWAALGIALGILFFHEGHPLIAVFCIITGILTNIFFWKGDFGENDFSDPGRAGNRPTLPEIFAGGYFISRMSDKNNDDR